MKKKIVVIINNLGIGGAERLVVDSINEMLSRKIEVYLITLKIEKKETLFQDLNLKKTNCHLIDFQSLFDFKKLIILIKTIKEINPDVVITHLWFSNTIGRIAAFISRIPIVLSFEHGFYDKSKNRMVFTIDRLLQGFSTKIIAVSAFLKDNLVARGINEKKIEVILNGIEIENYSNAKLSNIRNEFNLKDEFIFISVGSLIEQKNMDVLIRAFSELKEGVLLLVGDGKERHSLNNLVNELRISNRVYFLGRRSDVPNLLKSADCFVFLSRNEGLPLVIVEAMASGLPIIVSDFNSINEIARDGIDVRIVKRGDVSESANAMKEIMFNRAQGDLLVKNSKDSVKKFSMKGHVDRILELIYNI